MIGVAPATAARVRAETTAGRAIRDEGLVGTTAQQRRNAFLQEAEAQIG